VPGGANDEPTQQKGIMGNNPTQVSESNKNRQEKYLG
jgi:hypothetical protein